MANSAGYHESEDKLRTETQDNHRALTSMMEELEADGLMTDAGRAAFALRDASDPGYSLGEQPDRLPDPYEEHLRQDADAAAFWDACPPGYRKRVSFWVETAKREDTRARRVEQLRAACAAGKRLER